MWSKNKAPMTDAERAHVDRIKSIPCIVCDAPPPSDAHELEQGLWWTSLPLCRDCHQGSHNGIHGQRRMWLVQKLTELKALNKLLALLLAGGSRA